MAANTEEKNSLAALRWVMKARSSLVESDWASLFANSLPIKDVSVAFKIFELAQAHYSRSVKFPDQWPGVEKFISALLENKGSIAFSNTQLVQLSSLRMDLTTGSFVDQVCKDLDNLRLTAYFSADDAEIHVHKLNALFSSAFGTINSGTQRLRDALYTCIAQTFDCIFCNGVQKGIRTIPPSLRAAETFSRTLEGFIPINNCSSLFIWFRLQANAKENWVLQKAGDCYSGGGEESKRKHQTVRVEAAELVK